MRKTTRNLPLSEVYEIVLNGASDKPRAHQRFIHYNLRAIKEITDNGKFNLFIPVHLGGCGFPIFEEVLPLVEITSFQRRFATFVDSRIKESMEIGVYPKKYLSALVDDTEFKDTMQSYIRHAGKYTLINAPFGPLEEGEKDYSVKQVVAPTLSNLVLFPNEEKKLKYRLPARSLMSEFNKYNKTLLSVEESVKRQRASDIMLLRSQPLRLVMKY
jgi:hypothetical protein